VEPWRTDGTPAGTAIVADLEPGPGSSLPGDYADFGHAFVAHFGRVYFQAMTSGSASLQLWSTDGTAPGTFMVRQFPAPRTSRSTCAS